MANKKGIMMVLRRHSIRENNKGGHRESHLKDKREGHVIKKRRYFVELDNGFTAEVDIFSGHLEGLRMVEVEFKSEEDYLRFEKPDWFLDDVTTDSEFSNSSLSGVSSISKIKKLKRK